MLLQQNDRDTAVNRSTLAERAADLLREQILLEKLKPKEILAERVISEKFGISRTPMREALRILASEGLVEMNPNLRPRVASPSLAQILDLIDVLSSLERLACEILSEKASSFVLSRLDRQIDLLGSFPDDGDELEFFKIDMEFHKTIVGSTENQPLIKTHSQYNAAVFRARFMSTKWVARRPLMQDQHSEIAELIRKRDGSAAGEMMRSHLMQLKINVTDLYNARDQNNGA